MKVFGDIKCIAVVILLVTVLVIHPALWGVVHDTHKLVRLVHEWQCAGAHTSLMGKVREFLSTAWWLGPLKVDSPRDPMKECGIPASLGWREMLPMIFDLKARVACLEEQVIMADKEHKEFMLKFVLAVCCLMFVCVFGVLLARWTWARFTLAREAQSSLVMAKINTQNYDELERLQDYVLERCILVVVYEMMTSDGLIIRKGKYVQFANISNDKHVSDTPLALPSVKRNDKDATSVVRRSLNVPSRFRDRLWGSEEIHLTKMRDKYNVDVFPDAKRGRLHIKGSKNNVLQGYAAVKDLLAEWRTLEDAPISLSGKMRCVVCERSVRNSSLRSIVTHRFVRS